MVQCLNSTFGTYWFYLEFFGGREEGFGVFCFVLLEDWSVKERSSIGLVSASCHRCFTPDLIKTLSLICLCLGQTSFCVFCSGSSLPRWPWTMSGRTVGFFSSLLMTAVGSCRNPKKAQYRERVGLCRLSRTTA